MKAIVYFLHNPWPPKSGAHHRCLQMLRILQREGYEVIFASSTLHTEYPWNEESKAALASITGSPVQIFQRPNLIVRKIDGLEKRLRLWRLGKRRFREAFFCPRSLIRWFRRLVDSHDPDLVLVNYAWFDQLVDHDKWKDRKRVMETIDFASVNQRMWAFVEKQLDACEQGASASRLREDFITTKSTYTIDEEEVEIYQRYTTVACISNQEKEILEPLVSGVEVAYIPFVPERTSSSNTYVGPPLLSVGRNPFNLQGYFYFVDAILPKILAKAPSFRLRLTGSMIPPSRFVPQIDWLGFVENRDSLFEEAGYSICPVFAGTGQQTKIAEAMAYGLAVVAFEEAARDSFLRHGENGLVAASADEFARHVVRLEGDPRLRRELGNAARQSILSAEQETQRCASLALGSANSSSV